MFAGDGDDFLDGTDLGGELQVQLLLFTGEGEGIEFGSILFVGEHPDDVAGGDTAEGIEADFGEVQAMPFGEETPGAPMEGHGVGQCAIAIEDEAGGDEVGHGKGGKGSILEKGEALQDFGADEGIEEGIEIAFDEVREVVEGDLDPVIGDAVLGEVVGADLFGAVAGTDLAAAFAGHLLGFLGHLPFKEAGTEDHHGLGLVLVLGTFVLATDFEAGGFVDDADGGVGGIDALTAMAAGAADADFEIFGANFDIDLLGFGEDGDGGGGSVDPTLGLGGGDALDAMDAGFVFEAFEDVLAGHQHDDVLEATEVGGAGIEGFDLPTLIFRVTRVHAAKVGSEQGCLGSTGGGADLDDGVPGVGGIGGSDAVEEAEGQLMMAGFEGGEFLGGHLGEFGTGGFGDKEIAIGDDFIADAAPGLAIGDEIAEAGMFPGEFLAPLGIGEGVRGGQLGFHLVKATTELLDERDEIHGSGGAIWKNKPARGLPGKGWEPAGGLEGGRLLLLFLGSGLGLGGLGSLGLGQALLEFVHAASGIDELLLARVERVAGVADADEQLGLGGTGLDRVATGAADLGLHVSWMCVCLHVPKRNAEAISRPLHDKTDFQAGICIAHRVPCRTDDRLLSHSIPR